MTILHFFASFFFRMNSSNSKIKEGLELLEQATKAVNKTWLFMKVKPDWDTATQGKNKTKLKTRLFNSFKPP